MTSLLASRVQPHYSRAEYAGARTRVGVQRSTLGGASAPLRKSQNSIRMKSTDDSSRGPGDADGSVTPRYITKKSPRNVGKASSKPTWQYLVFSARSSFLTIRPHLL